MYHELLLALIIYMHTEIACLMYLDCGITAPGFQNQQATKRGQCSRVRVQLTANFVLCPTLQMTALPLALSDYKRYGRQMILDGFGLEGTSPH